jgi:hypothetical protein
MRRIGDAKLLIEANRIIMVPEAGIGTDIDADENDPTGELAGDLLEARHLEATGGAVAGPEIRDHGLFCSNTFEKLESWPPRIASPW